MKTVQTPGPLMRLSIANKVAELRGKSDTYLEVVADGARMRAEQATEDYERVYFTAFAGAVEALRKEQS